MFYVPFKRFFKFKSYQKLNKKLQNINLHIYKHHHTIRYVFQRLNKYFSIMQSHFIKKKFLIDLKAFPAIY